MSHFICALFCIFSLLYQQTWVGKKVMPRKEAVIEVAGKEITPDQFVGAPYTVIESKGGWLRLAHSDVARIRVKHALQLDRAPAYYAKLLRADRTDIWALGGRGTVWLELDEFHKAIDDFSESLRVDPTNTFALVGRGDAYYELERYDDAMKNYSESIQVDPTYSFAYEGRGACLEVKGDLEGALRDYDEAFRLDPTAAEYSAHRGDIYKMMDRVKEAIAEYDRALQLDPYDADTHSSLARIRSMCPMAEFRDGEKAVEHATKACELKEWKDTWSLRALAVACAEEGNFDAALKWELEAEKHASKKDQDPEWHKWRLEVFRSRHAVREDSQGFQSAAGAEPPEEQAPQ